MGLLMLHAVHIFQYRVDWLLIPLRVKGQHVVDGFAYAAYDKVLVDQPSNLTPGTIDSDFFKVSFEIVKAVSLVLTLD